MVRYGFISAGGGHWYSNTLKQLEPGHRIFACIPKTGYVGVGIVRESVQPVGDFLVDINGTRVPILDKPLNKPAMADEKDDPDKREYLVRVSYTPKLWMRLRRKAAYLPG